MNDKIGRFNLPIKSPNKNLLCVMQKSPNFVGQDRACSIFGDCVSRLCISDNKFCLCCHGDCLQQKMNIHF